MKNLYLVILALLALLIGCAKQPQTDDNLLIITAMSTDFETKASETAFEAGDKIGVFLESSHGNNALYETVDGSTWRGYDHIDKVKTGEKATAYYPYSGTATNMNAIEVSENVDFMVTDATPITLGNNRASVALQFKHVLSKLVAKMAIPSEIAGVKTVSLDSIVVKNVFRKAVIDLATEKITGLTDRGDIVLKSGEAIIIPQTISRIEFVFKMANGTFMKQAYPENLLLESGKKTTLNAVSNADLYFTSTLDLKSGEAQTNIHLSFYVAPNRKWTLTSSAPWLTITPNQGTGAATVKVDVTANNAVPYKPRTAILTLTTTNNGVKITQIVIQNYTRLVEIAGTKWTTTNLTGTYQGQITDFTISANPQDYGYFWKWGSKYAYTHPGANAPSGHWGGYTTMAATYPTAQSRKYDYANVSGVANSGDPCIALGAYRTPTQEQWAALFASGASNWTNYEGVAGRFFGQKASLCTTSTIQDGCIFLPAVGYRDWPDGSLIFQGGRGNYWASSVYNSPCGWSSYFDNSAIRAEGYSSRSHGLSVRCVAQ